LSSISIKRCASHWCKGLHWGRWLSLESSFFMDTTTYIGKTPLVLLLRYHT
jgi:hypothetical protein